MFVQAKEPLAIVDKVYSHFELNKVMRLPSCRSSVYGPNDQKRKWDYYL